MAKKEKNIDLLETSIDTWNNRNLTEGLTVKHNCLAGFDYVPTALTLGDKPTKWKVLTLSDHPDRVVGVPFKDSYGLVDNHKFLEVCEKIKAKIESTGLKVSVATAGTLRDRGRMFLSFKIEGHETFKVGHREFHAFLNNLNSVDKSCSVTFANNTFCVCCANTFAHALHCTDGTDFHAKMKHSKGILDILEDVPRVVEYWITGNENLVKTFKQFESFPMTVTEAEQVFAEFLVSRMPGKDKELSPRSFNIVEALSKLFREGRGNKGETAMDCFSAVTEQYTHFSAGKTDDDMKQVESSELGLGALNKESFFWNLSTLVQDTEKYRGVCKVGDRILIAYHKAAKEGAFKRIRKAVTGK